MSSTILSIPIPDVLSVLRDHVEDPQALKRITEELTKIQRELAAEKEAEKEANANGPKTKNRFVVLLRSDDPKAAQAVAAGAYVLAVPDDDTTDTYNGRALIERLKKAVRHHNDGGSKSGRGRKKMNIKRFADAMAYLKPKTLKETESKVLIKTKAPVEIIVVESENLVD